MICCLAGELRLLWLAGVVWVVDVFEFEGFVVGIVFEDKDGTVSKAAFDKGGVIGAPVFFKVAQRSAVGNDENVLVVGLVHDFGQGIIHALDESGAAFTAMGAEKFIVLIEWGIEVFGFSVKNTEVPFFESFFPGIGHVGENFHGVAAAFRGGTVGVVEVDVEGIDVFLGVFGLFDSKFGQWGVDPALNSFAQIE